MQQSDDKTIFKNDCAFTNVRYSVFGLGNSTFLKFCSYAKYLDGCLFELGAERIHELGLGDELCGQEEFFRKWSVGVYKSAVEAFCIDSDKTFIDLIYNDDSLLSRKKKSCSSAKL